MDRIHHNGPWLGAFLLEKCLPLHAFGVGHGDGAQDGVGPIDVAVDPVHRQPIRGLEILANDGVIGEAGGSVDLGTEGRGEGRGECQLRGPSVHSGTGAACGWGSRQAHL